MVAFADVLNCAFKAGHGWNPDNKHRVEYKDLKRLGPHDEEAHEIISSWKRGMVTEYAPLIYSEYKGREDPEFGGTVGKASKKLAKVKRCLVPDHCPPKDAAFQFDDESLQEVALQMQEDGPVAAIGPGNWSGCLVKDFHSAIVKVDSRNMPSFLQGQMFKDILTDVQFGYAGVGLLFRFIDERGHDILTGEDLSGKQVNIDFSFVTSSDGWVGLAIVGQNRGCRSRIWCRYLNRYRPNNIRQEWATLIYHELGHNCGLYHISGNWNKMNSVIRRGLPMREWAINDSSTPVLRGKYKGVPAPIPGGDVPPLPPNPPDLLDQRLLSIESDVRSNALSIGQNTIADVVRDAKIQWLIEQHR